MVVPGAVHSAAWQEDVGFALGVWRDPGRGRCGGRRPAESTPWGRPDHRMTCIGDWEVQGIS